MSESGEVIQFTGSSQKDPLRLEPRRSPCNLSLEMTVSLNTEGAKGLRAGMS